MIPFPKSHRGLTVALLLASAQALFAIDAAPVVITTHSGERFIGTPGAAEPGFVRLVSQTLGEIRIPRASILTLTPGPEAAPVAAPVAAAAPAVAPAPPAAPKKGFIQSRLDLPGKFDASVGGGLMAQSGIFEQSTWSASLDVAWEVGANEYYTSMQASRQTTHGVVLNDSFHWDARLEHNFTPKRFMMAASFYREDSVMAVDREEVLFLGAGFNFVKTPTTEVVTVIGPSYIWQEYLPPGPGLPAPPSMGDPAAVLYQSVSHAVIPRMRVSASVLVAQSLEYHSKHLARLILSLDFALSENLTLSNSYFLMRDALEQTGPAKHQGMLTTQLKLRL
jgi:hypothetical protein